MAATLFMMAACSGNGGKSETETETADSLAIEKTDSAEKDSVDIVSSATNVAKSPTFNGLMMVEPQQQATLSMTMGGKIHSLKILPGQSVAKGQLLAVIDNPEYIELQQSYLDASAQLEYLSQEYERQRTLGEKDAASQKKVQQSKADYLSMRSRYQAAASRLKALGVNLGQIQQQGIQPYLSVYAPISGYITNLQVNLGSYVDAGEPLCDIIKKTQPLIQLTVYEKDIALMTVGRAVEFRVNGMGKQTFQAAIISVEQAVDQKDYSIKVYARVKDSHPSFRPGMYVRAKVK